MPVADVDGYAVAYEIVGNGGQPWVITPGGRFSKDAGGVRELAERLAESGRQVLIWDRPNTGASEVCFEGENESAMQADRLAGLLRSLGMAPAVISGGSGGARVSLLTASRHPDVASGLVVWWITGGAYGLMNLAIVYCANSINAAWRGGMEEVLTLPEWQEPLERNPANRQRFLDLDPRRFIETLQRWMLVYYPFESALVPGLPNEDARRLQLPAMVFRSGVSDPHHTRATSERLAELIPTAEMVEPPWGDGEWNERSDASRAGQGPLFAGWPALAPQLIEFADRRIKS